MATLNVMTATNLTHAIPELWAPSIRYGATRESVWGKFTGKEGSRAAVIRRDDLTKEAGDTIHMNVISPLKGAGVTGENPLAGNEEKMMLNPFDVIVDYIRHAVAVNKKGRNLANIDILAIAKKGLTGWLARHLDDKVFTTAMPYVDAKLTQMYANGDSTLDSGDGLDVGDLQMARLTLVRQGAIPWRVVKASGESVNMYGGMVDPLTAY